MIQLSMIFRQLFFVMNAVNQGKKGEAKWGGRQLQIREYPGYSLKHVTYESFT